MKGRANRRAIIILSAVRVVRARTPHTHTTTIRITSNQSSHTAPQGARQGTLVHRDSVPLLLRDLRLHILLQLAQLQPKLRKLRHTPVRHTEAIALLSLGAQGPLLRAHPPSPPSLWRQVEIGTFQLQISNAIRLFKKSEQMLVWVRMCFVFAGP